MARPSAYADGLFSYVLLAPYFFDVLLFGEYAGFVLDSYKEIVDITEKQYNAYNA